MFQMTTDVVTFTQVCSHKVWQNSIAKIKGDNVFLADKQLTAVVKSLA
jgi:hypothetical protein